MKTILLVLVAATRMALAIEINEKFHDGESPIWGDIDSANVELFYVLHMELFVQEQRYDKTTRKFVERVEIKKAELSRYLSKRPKKELAVVMIEKNDLDRDKLKLVVSEIVQVFHGSGFKRIIVLGAHSAASIVYGDFKNRTTPQKPNKAAHANPLPAPSRKSNENHNP